MEENFIVQCFLFKAIIKQRKQILLMLILRCVVRSMSREKAQKYFILKMHQGASYKSLGETYP